MTAAVKADLRTRRPFRCGWCETGACDRCRGALAGGVCTCAHVSFTRDQMEARRRCWVVVRPFVRHGRPPGHRARCLCGWRGDTHVKETAAFADAFRHNAGGWPSARNAGATLTDGTGE